jgi:hypothetical protein
MEYPHYLVKLSSLECDQRGRHPYVWNLWKIATEGQRYRCLEAYASEAEGDAAAVLDRLKVPHF